MEHVESHCECVVLDLQSYHMTKLPTIQKIAIADHFTQGGSVFCGKIEKFGHTRLDEVMRASDVN